MVVVLELHNVVEATRYALVTAYVVAVESYRHNRPNAAVNFFLIHDRHFLAIYYARACVALGVQIEVAFVNLIVLFVTITQSQIKFLRLFASPLGYDSGFLSCLDCFFDGFDSLLSRLRDQNVSHKLALSVTVWAVLLENVGVTKAAWAKDYLSIINYFRVYHNCMNLKC